METPLGLGLERLLGANGPSVCPVAKLIATLTEAEAELLQRVMLSSASTRQIHNELTASGFRIGRDTIANHRRGWCRCNGGQQ
jgi:DNA-binding CsgD family transcriptional regulator